MATNGDAFDFVNGRRMPGTGCLVAAVQHVAGRPPDAICGKPSPELAHFLLEHFDLDPVSRRRRPTRNFRCVPTCVNFGMKRARRVSHDRESALELLRVRRRRRRLGGVFRATSSIVATSSGTPQARTCVVGDRLDTDVRLGAAMGARTLLVLTGVATLEHAQALPQNDPSRPDSVASCHTKSAREKHTTCRVCVSGSSQRNKTLCQRERERGSGPAREALYSFFFSHAWSAFPRDRHFGRLLEAAAASSPQTPLSPAPPATPPRTAAETARDAACSRARAEASATLDAVHDAARAADGRRYFALFRDDAVFLGTDADERWSMPEFRNYAGARFDRGEGWSYKVLRRSVSLVGNNTVFFDEQLSNEKLGDCRSTGALIRDADGWKVAQYSLSIPIPNKLALTVAADIATFRRLNPQC